MCSSSSLELPVPPLCLIFVGDRDVVNTPLLFVSHNDVVPETMKGRMHAYTGSTEGEDNTVADIRTYLPQGKPRKMGLKKFVLRES